MIRRGSERLTVGRSEYRRIVTATMAMFAGLASACCLAQDAAQPIVGVSVLGDFDGTAEQGEPMRLLVVLRADDAARADEEIVLAPAGSAWTDQVEVKVVARNGTATNVTASVVGVPESTVATLNPERIAGGLWRLAPGATSSLPPGPYAIRATLKIEAVAPGSGGWTGRVDSPDVPLGIVGASSDPYRHGQHQVAIAQDLMIDGRLEEAAQVIDTLLDAQPENVTAWVVRAVIGERAGNLPAALFGIGRARELYYGTGDGGEFTEPNPDLESIQQRLMAMLVSASPTDASGAAAPDWSWPPAMFTAPVPPAPSSPPSSAFAAQSETPAVSNSTRPSSGTAATAATGTSSTAEVATAAEAATTTGAPMSKPSAAKITGVEIAVVAVTNEAPFLADPNGQWAVTATASSEYAPDRYNAMQATGAPDVEDYSDNPKAWCHSSTSNQEDWLELTYAKPVVATELRVRQNYTPGTIAKVEAFAADGRALLLWEGTDPNVYPDRRISWFVLRFPPTPFAVSRIRLTLNIPAIGGWKQIDAVQLVGSPPAS